MQSTVANDIQLRIAVFERLFTRFDHADNTVGGLKRLCFQELKLFRLARAADKGRGCARHQQEQHAKPDTGCHVFRDSEARHLTQARKQNQTDREITHKKVAIAIFGAAISRSSR